MANIRGYVKKVGGKTVTVTPYNTRADAAVEENSGDPRKLPGRPIITAGIGRFPADRVIPNVYITPTVKKPTVQELPPELGGPDPKGQAATDASKPGQPPVPGKKKPKDDKKVKFSDLVDDLVRLTR